MRNGIFVHGVIYIFKVEAFSHLVDIKGIKVLSIHPNIRLYPPLRPSYSDLTCLPMLWPMEIPTNSRYETQGRLSYISKAH